MKALQTILSNIPSTFWLTQSTPQQSAARVGAIALSAVAVAASDASGWTKSFPRLESLMPSKVTAKPSNLLKKRFGLSEAASATISTATYYTALGATVSLMARGLCMGISLKEASMGSLLTIGLGSLISALKK